MAAEESKERLADRLTDLVGEPVDGLTLLTGGASRTTWAFDTPTRQLILRLDPPAAQLKQMEREARCLRAAGAAGVPVPTVVAASDDSSVIGSSFMILERIGGETIPRRILRDPEFGPCRANLLGQSAEALVAIHAVDPASVEGLDSSDQLDSWAARLHALPTTLPALEVALLWLEGHRPEARKNVFVHGDFRLGNLMVGPEGLRAVLDWELAHAGDPVEDLGWMCVRAWRFSSSLPALGLGSYEQLCEAYEAAGGLPADPGALSWWELFGTWRWGIICAGMAEVSRASGNLSVELAAIGRRTCENEWDVLACLERSGVEIADVDAAADLTAPATPQCAAAGLHGVPAASEIVAAVRAFLEESVRPSLEGSVAFHARIAGRVLAMVERELALGAVQGAAHSVLLARLGLSSEAEMASAVRSGRLAHDDPVLLGTIRWSAAARLEVAHPGYREG